MPADPRHPRLARWLKLGGLGAFALAWPLLLGGCEAPTDWEHTLHELGDSLEMLLTELFRRLLAASL
jgi:hypothetical protein